MSFAQADIEHHAPGVVMWDWTQCRHDLIERFGFTDSGEQKYRCAVCGDTWVFRDGMYQHRTLVNQYKDVVACPAGHEYTAENTRVYRGKRYCRACQKARDAGRKR